MGELEKLICNIERTKSEFRWKYNLAPNRVFLTNAELYLAKASYAFLKSSVEPTTFLGLKFIVVRELVDRVGLGMEG